MTMPGLWKCDGCQKFGSPCFPPLGQLYIIEIDGIKFLQNEYLVNKKLRNEKLKNMEDRKNQIKPSFFGLSKTNKLSKNEEVEFKQIEEDIEFFEQRRKANLLTKVEEDYLRNHADSITR